jgi:hypothetical protein
MMAVWSELQSTEKHFQGRTQNFLMLNFVAYTVTIRLYRVLIQTEQVLGTLN